MTKTLAATKLRNQLLAEDPTLVVALRNVRVNGNLFGCSGFVTATNGNVVYVNTDHNHGLREDQPLYRTARDTRDYTGGTNRTSTNAKLAADVVALLRNTKTQSERDQDERIRENLAAAYDDEGRPQVSFDDFLDIFEDRDIEEFL